MAITDGLTLYSMLDHIENGKVLDLSGQGRHGTVAGGAQIVLDATFGHCLSLDGVDDWVTLPAASLSAGQQLTVALWLHGASGLPLATSVFYASSTAGHRVLNLHIPWSDGQVYFDCGNVGSSFDRIQKQASAADYKSSWAHWAFVKNAATGEMRIYRNGVLWHQATGRVRAVTAAAAVRLGASTDDQYKYPGKVAHLRIYNRALSAGEIGEVMAEDKSALAVYRSSHPLEIDLRNSDGESVLYIIDSPDGNRTTLEVTNTSGQLIDILEPQAFSFPESASAESMLPPPPAPVSAGNHHFSLRFRPGTVSIADESLVGWTALQDLAADGTAMLYLLSSEALHLDPGATLKIPLPKLTVNGTGGARGTRAEARYRQLSYANDTMPLQGQRTLHLSLLNHTGLRSIPLHLGFAGDNRIMNDGRTQNSLTLHITNLLKNASIALHPSTHASPSKLILSFDVDQDWALGTSSQVAAITITPQEPGSWTVNLQTQGQSPEWIVTTPARTSLGPGETIKLNLTNIISSKPNGQTRLYLRYENIPGHWDGQLVALIEKSPLRFVGRNVLWSRNSSLRDDQGGSLELGGDSSITTGNPYIDFHSGGNIEDYNVRLINDGYRQLTVIASTLRVNGNIGLGGNAIQQGINFHQDETPVNFNAQARWFAHLTTNDAIRVVGGSGGVLATRDQDILLWGKSTTHPGKGHVLVKGILAATDKWFRIDHPARPDHDLVHACLEGPESAVYYRGVARLVGGQATVRLPGYFESLTRQEGRTVQLTAKGREPFLVSYEDIVDGAFRIYGSKPDGEVSWEVKAVRSDVEELVVEVGKA